MGFEAANQYLAAKGIQSSKFEDLGQSHTGLLIDADSQVVTDKQGVIQMLKDGITPKMQLVLTWKTDEREPSNPGDKGIRKLYCSWRLEAAIKAAVRAAGGQGLEENGELTVTFTQEEKIQGFAGKAKLYDVSYKLPTKLLGATPGAVSNTVTSAPASAPAVPPSYSAADMATATTLHNAGTSLAIISQATGISVYDLETQFAI